MQKKGGGSLPDYKLDFPLKKSEFNIRERKKTQFIPGSTGLIFSDFSSLSFLFFSFSWKKHLTIIPG